MESSSAHEARLAMVARKFGAVRHHEVRPVGMSGVTRASVSMLDGALAGRSFTAEARDPRNAVRNCLKALEAAHRLAARKADYAASNLATA